MRKLRMAIVLPLVHIAASMAIFGFELAPSGGFNGTVRCWVAMNAPVLVFIDIVKRIARWGGCHPQWPGEVAVSVQSTLSSWSAGWPCGFIGRSDA